MINRGIHFYDIDSIKNKLFYPMLAKEFETLLVNEDLSISDSELQPKIVVSTETLSFFTGEYEFHIIPTKIVELYLLSKSFSYLLEDPIVAENEGLKAQYESTVAQLEEIQEIADKDVWGMRCFIVAYEIEGKEKTLRFVRIGIPKDLKPFLTDERIYELEDGIIVRSTDGLPMNGVYYYYIDGKIRYTSDPSKGEHIGA